MKLLLICLVFLILLFIILFIIQSIKIRKLSSSSKNNVHFYVARDEDNSLWLYLSKPVRSERKFMPASYGRTIRLEKYFSNYGLDVNDYANLKWEDEPVEVFLNLGNSDSKHN